MADKPVLFKITNLKQHFPLKKKGLYVKANDGINLNIYDGEVLGLVENPAAENPPGAPCSGSMTPRTARSCTTAGC